MCMKNKHHLLDYYQFLASCVCTFVADGNHINFIRFGFSDARNTCMHIVERVYSVLIRLIRIGCGCGCISISKVVDRWVVYLIVIC